jgi:hypothetical protein
MGMYCTIDDLKGEGVKTSAVLTAARLNDLIAQATQYIDIETCQWFEKRDYDEEDPFLVDGSGSSILRFPVPIIAVESITVNDEVIDPDYYVAYCRIPYDRTNPKIVRRSDSLSETGYETDPFYPIGYSRTSEGIWPRGRQNVKMVGSLGYVDRVEDSYVTPVVVKRIAMRLVVRELEPMYGAGMEGIEERKRSRLQSETTDAHSYSLSALAVSGGMTGDPDIDGPLARLHAPIYCRAL